MDSKGFSAVNYFVGIEKKKKNLKRIQTLKKWGLRSLLFVINIFDELE